MHRKDRFGPEQHRYWLEQAQPPEDYIYENLSVSRPVRLLRLGLSRWGAGASSAGVVDTLLAALLPAAGRFSVA